MSERLSLLVGHMPIEPSPYGRAVPKDVSGCGVGHPLLWLRECTAQLESALIGGAAGSPENQGSGYLELDCR